MADALQTALEEEIYRALNEVIQHRLARMEACADIKVMAWTSATTQVRVWPQPFGSDPRTFNIIVKEVT
jgi:hypothetical protein